MRPIKFRIWHGSKFVTYSDTYIRTSDGSLWYSEEDYGGTFSSHEKLYSFDGKIQQYTGLKDKNGKDVYEGDIIKFDNVKLEVDSKSIVKWITEEEYDYTGWQISSNYAQSGPFEVIGNIFENPELLDKPKEL